MTREGWGDPDADRTDSAQAEPTETLRAPAVRAVEPRSPLPGYDPMQAGPGDGSSTFYGFEVLDFDPTAGDHFEVPATCPERVTLMTEAGGTIELLCEVEGPHDEHAATVTWGQVIVAKAAVELDICGADTAHGPCTLAAGHPEVVAHRGALTFRCNAPIAGGPCVLPIGHDPEQQPHTPRTDPT